MKKVSLTLDPHADCEHGYSEFLANVQHRASTRIQDFEGNLFTTATAGLFDVFINHLPPAERQHYNCNACRHFFNHFGGLVTIDQDGVQKSAIWPDDVPPFFQPAVAALRKEVETATVTGVFLNTDKVWGDPITGPWHHVAVRLHTPIAKPRVDLTVGQRMAEKREEFKMLRQAREEYSIETVREAVRILKSDALYRSEKTLGVAEFFLWVHTVCTRVRTLRAKRNLMWLAVAKAPAGFCHVKASMIGTLLDDIQAKRPFDVIRARFNEKMNPLQYQRPQVAPSEGNIEQGERLIEKMDLASALKRRFARLEEVDALWRPRKGRRPRKEGVFSELEPKGSSKSNPMVTPTKVMTWEKFQKTVLHEALSMELFIPRSSSTYGAILTASDPDAKPILRWDTEDIPNPFSWYIYAAGSMPERWGLLTNRYCKVTAVCKTPCHWYGKTTPGMVDGAFLILEGAKDQHSPGLALFPEILRTELRPVRATIEAFSEKGTLEGAQKASACGLYFTADRSIGCRLRVTTSLGQQEYLIDRWD